MNESKQTEQFIDDQELMPPKDIKDAVLTLGKFFDAPKEAVEKGLKTPVYIVSPDKCAEAIKENLIDQGMLKKQVPLSEDATLDMVAKALGTSRREINMAQRQQEDRLQQEFSSFGGVTLTDTKGNTVIYINKEAKTDRAEILDHELLHTMAKNKKGSGFQSEEGEGHNLNEAMTQLLTLAKKYNLAPDQLAIKIRKGEIKTPYPNLVMQLAASIGASSLGPKPITVKEVARDYFKKGDPSIKRYMFGMKVAQRAPPNQQGLVADIMGKFNAAKMVH